MQRRKLEGIQKMGNSAENNMFHFNKGDGVAYLVLYIIIPVLITTLSLITMSKTDKIAEIYCYISIMISAFNCIYDGANRWDKVRSGRNAKLFLILGSNGIIALYCIIEILQIFLLKKVIFELEYTFLIYIVVIVVALHDVYICFGQDIVWKDCL